MEVKSYAVDCI